MTVLTEPSTMARLIAPTYKVQYNERGPGREREREKEREIRLDV